MQKIIIIICFVILFCIVILCIQKKNKDIDLKKQLYFNLNNDYLHDRKNCDLENTYCFDNNDCALQCDNGIGEYSCVKGLCVSNLDELNENKPNVTECDTHKGIMALLLGKVGWNWEWTCKSLDPAIALEDGNNKMCKNGDIKIDYFEKLPEISDCKNCEGMVIVPATQNKRRHVECNKDIVDFVKYN